MQKLFSSEELKAKDRFRSWLEFSDARFMPMVHTRTDEDVFDATAQGVSIGDLAITRSSFNALELETDYRTIRHHLNKPDVLGFSIKLSAIAWAANMTGSSNRATARFPSSTRMRRSSSSIWTGRII